jgi:protein phosphatase
MIIELPEIACVLIHGCNHDTARAIATRHFADDEILEMGAASGEALLRALEPRIAAGKLTAIIEAGSPPGAHKLRVALASVARENYARRFGLILPDARPGEPNIDERLKADGYREVFEIPIGALDTFEIRRNRMPTDVRHEHGPFDIIGDVHGCGDELVDLLERLGYAVAWKDTSHWQGRLPVVTPPAGRRVIFVGDLVDRGPRGRDALAIVHAMVEQDPHALYAFLERDGAPLVHTFEAGVPRALLAGEAPVAAPILEALQIDRFERGDEAMYESVREMDRWLASQP